MSSPNDAPEPENVPTNPIFTVCWAETLLVRMIAKLRVNAAYKLFMSIHLA
jgi:hypothetical protein